MKSLNLNDINIGKKYIKNDESKTMNVTSKIRKKDIAIIGIAIKAGFSENCEELWDTLVNGRSDLHIIDDQRKEDFFNYLASEGGVDKNHLVRFKKFSCMKDVDKFDGDFFGINPAEVKMMDPIQRLFLQTCYHTLEDAGYGAENINGKSIGVYIGNSVDEVSYLSHLKGDDCDEGKVFTGNLCSIVPSRISYYMNLRGPSVSYDTGCSSSFTALHEAINALINEDCQMAIVGGVRYNFVPPLLNFEQMEIFSRDGFTRSFDDFSDGTNKGETSCAIVIKQLSKAIEDNDHVYAVIKGSAINNDGASLGITAPNMDAQEKMLAHAWKNAEVNPDTISYIECHGTGTYLGDPIEVNAIINAFKKYTDRKQFCAVGSVKSNLSHSGAAAGIVGLIKTVLAMKNKVIPPSINFDIPNSSIDFIDSPLYVNNYPKKWCAETIRCGVNSFSMNGTNVHIVLEEFKDNRPPVKEDKYKILCLSAQKSNSLEELLKRYIDLLKKNKDVSLSNLAYTVNTSRKLFDYRAAIVFETHEQLVTELENIIYQINENKISSTVMKNDSNESVKLIKDFISSNKECKENLEGLGRVFCEGGRIDWNLLYDKADYYRINAPLYPYQKKRYWYEYDGRRKFEYKFEDYCCKMLDNKMFPDDLKMQLEKFTNELNKYNSANSEDSISDLITLKGRTDDNYTDSERCIARKCYETFGYSEIDINDGFEMYNSDSLQMTTLYGKLRSEYNINLTDLYKYDSIRKLAEKIESNKMDIYKTKEKILEIYNKGIMESRDYYTDSRLMYAERIQKLNVIDFKVKKCYNNVMVTGVTGYLGIYILRELLENTEVKVSLIIRRMDNVSAEERLRGKIGKYFGSEFFDKYMERINVYEGDMFDTGFGLGETYSCLKEEVDCIVHCAANTSHFGEYSEFYEANVSMTENIIMFAEEGRKKDIHHISTYAVAQFNGAGNGMFVTEFDDVNTDHIDDVELFYPKTKIIAEKLINAARERGINANIYRVDDILFEYERGIMQENIDNSAVSLVMRSFLELGIIPDVIGLSYEFTFVDCAARSIVKLMSLSAYKCDNFHIGNPNTTELKDCLSDSRNIIHSELVSLSDFLDKGIEFFESSSSKFSIFNDILIHCFDGGNIQEDYRASEVGDDFTNSILEKMNFHWPELTPKVFNKYLSHCISVGFIKES